jgi:hypothetical protein
VILVVEFSFLDQIPLNLDDVQNAPVGLFFPPMIFVFPPKKRNVPFKLLHSFHSILYHSVGFKMAVLPIIQEDIIYDDESVFEEEAKIRKRHNLKLLVTVTIYYEELKHRRKRTKKECSGDERNTRDDVNTKAPFCMPPRNAREMS